MNNRRMVLTQIAIFCVITIVVAYYALFHVIGLSLTNNPYEVKLVLATGGGVFDGSDVSYRGVRIGSVSGVQLRPDSVLVTLDIDEGHKVPVDSIAHVTDLSPVGEQYVDFVSKTGHGPYLHNGSVVPTSRTTTPLQTATVLFDLEQWINSINPKDLGVLSREFAAAFAGAGPQLREILTAGESIVNTLDDTRDAVLSALHSSSILLQTAAKHADDFALFTRSVLQISQTLKASTPTIEKFLAQGPSTTTLINDIIRQDGSAAAVVLGNLAAFSQIQAANIPGWKALLIAVPQFERMVPQVINNGRVNGLGVINYDQTLCQYGPKLTSPISAIQTPVAKVACANPPNGTLERGAQNAPRPAGASANSLDETPLGVSAQLTSSGAAQVAGYDPRNGLVVNSQGQTVRLGWNGGQTELLGSNSWQAVFLAGVGS